MRALGDKVKLQRAHGGCLGDERRRRTWTAAKSSGEPLTGSDPEISEWDNPRRDYLPAVGEFIAGGSEPGELKHLSTQRKRKQVSDSPSSGERKGTSLNQLSASVSALLSWGRGTPHEGRHPFDESTKPMLAERSWNGRPQTVTAR
jgi:hypothetical protein